MLIYSIIWFDREGNFSLFEEHSYVDPEKVEEIISIKQFTDENHASYKILTTDIIK